MSIVPLLFSDWWHDLERPHQLLDQDFGLGLTPEQIVLPSIFDQYRSIPYEERYSTNPLVYYRPWSSLMRQTEGGGTSTVKADKDKFQVILDVQQFKPNEIMVKLVDKFVVVEGKHEEQKDEHGTISRHFIRKYMIPEQCDIDQVSSSLSSDGVLSITAPRKEKKLLSNERVIKINHTGKPVINEENRKIIDKQNEKKEETCDIKKQK